MPSVTAVVVSYNVKDLLRECLRSLGREGVDAVVVDNGSRDSSAEMVKTEFGAVRLVARADNAGFAAAANEGARLARGEYIFFLNPDAEVVAGAADALASFLGANPRAAAAAPRVETPAGELERTLRDEPTAFNLAREHLPGLKRGTARFSPHDTRRRADWIVAAALMVRREVFEKIGGFDEAFALYYEDADLCLRLGDAGYEVWLEPAARVAHVGGASALPAFGSRAEVKLRYFRARNRLIRKRRGPGGLLCYRLLMSLLLGRRWIREAARGDGEERRFQRKALAAVWGK